MADKYEYYTKEAECNLKEFAMENPELSLGFMMKGIGYALLAVAHELKIIEQGMDIVRPTREEDK